MLRLISYLAPSIPADLYRLIASDLQATCGVVATLEFEESVSGPLEGDDEPFSSARADVGFLCAPSYRWMSASRPHTVELLPLPVPTDPRANGRPVYFAEIVIPSESKARKLTDLRGGVWAYNDRNSRSGWFSMIEKLGESFFSLCIESGSHLKSMELVIGGAADAAAIDSNTLRLHPHSGLRVIETWGPYAIQPAIIRSAVDPAMKARVAEALMTIHQRHGAELSHFGLARFAPPDESLYV
jgi:phosphonate transport system substrate-binding protein